MPWRLQSEPTTIEKVVAGISYLTGGFVGLLYMLLVKNSGQSNQFRFHTFQAIFLTLIVVLVQWAVEFLGHLLLPLMSLGGSGGTAAASYFLMGIGIVIKAFYLLFFYGAIMAFLGKFAEVPFISNIVRYNMRA